MFFKKDEKVFSLSGTSDVVRRGDIQSLWGEFFAYLLLAGFYRESEAEGEGSIGLNMEKLSSDRFRLLEAGYNPQIGDLIAKGLHQRFVALKASPDINDGELNILEDLDGIFLSTDQTYLSLSAKKLLWIAISRNLPDDYVTIAHYAAVTFGQKDFPSEAQLPRLYISIFGNIHLSREFSFKITAPTLIYGSKTEDGFVVTALWSFLSSQLDAFAELECAGYEITEQLSLMSFLASTWRWDREVSIPRFASALIISALSGIESGRGGPIAGRFYQQFLYGNTGNIAITRQRLLAYILDVMVKKMGDSHLDRLFPSKSTFRKLMDSRTIYGREPRRSALLDYALEALDSDLEVGENEKDTPSEAQPAGEVKDELPHPSEVPEMDPSTEVGGFDPSVPPPAVPQGTPTLDMDTIDLISFDKTGEGVDEDLYRSAVVALNDRLQNDDSVPVKAEVKDALDYWVNGFLYRTAITATKDQIASLGLQEYLKNVSTKG